MGQLEDISDELIFKETQEASNELVLVCKSAEMYKSTTLWSAQQPTR